MSREDLRNMAATAALEGMLSNPSIKAHAVASFATSAEFGIQAARYADALVAVLMPEAPEPGPEPGPEPEPRCCDRCRHARVDVHSPAFRDCLRWGMDVHESMTCPDWAVKS